MSEKPWSEGHHMLFFSIASYIRNKYKSLTLKNKHSFMRSVGYFRTNISKDCYSRKQNNRLFLRIRANFNGRDH